MLLVALLLVIEDEASVLHPSYVELVLVRSSRYINRLTKRPLS